MGEIKQNGKPKRKKKRKEKRERGGGGGGKPLNWETGLRLDRQPV